MILVFSQMNAYGTLPVVFLKTKTKNLMSMQEYGMNTYDYKKYGLIFEGNCYEIITDKITQRRVVVTQMKCFNHLGNGVSN